MKVDTTITPPIEQRKASDADPDEISKRIRFPAPKGLRHAEVRGGGFIVIERTRKKRLLRPSAWPVEVGDLAQAYAAAKRLRDKHPDKEFAIFEQIGAVPDGGDK